MVFYVLLSILHGVVLDQVIGSSASLFRRHSRKREWSFSSSPQPQNPNDKSSSLVVDVGFRLKFPEDTWSFFCGYVSGLICFRHESLSEEDEGTVHVICKPSTGQYEILPKLGRGRYINSSRSLLGLDPINKQFKVLSMVGDSFCHQTLTLGTGEKSWRKIQCPYPSSSKGICINGVLYYLTDYKKIVCFDVRSEVFKSIDKECEDDQLINYKGKLCVINNLKCAGEERSTLELRMCVLEDVEKQEWSKYHYTLRDSKFAFRDVSFVGVTARGEIVLSFSFHTCGAFYVFYFDPQTYTLQSFEIQGKEDEALAFGRNSVYAFLDHVEDLSVML
ncbi:unnamed protein product [Microthlaspi erraticum]|uniref:F-box associated beta-propeller type 3 domain-containing protein n=1 Tax=Microthlaspi erraticum TaxID=1685480 RepID=A0A6D2LMG7_9BRAS|nr:unnamed protein product [Microthlaspi erraticum]